MWLKIWPCEHADQPCSYKAVTNMTVWTTVSFLKRPKPSHTTICEWDPFNYKITIQLGQKAKCWISKQRQDTDIISKVQRLGPGPSHPHIPQVPFSLEVKWVRHAANHSPLSCPKVKNERRYMSVPPCAFVVCISTFTSGYMFWHSSATFMILNIRAIKNQYFCIP